MNNENPKKVFEQADDKFYNMPTSPASDLVMKTLGTSGNIKQLAQNDKAIRTGTEYTFKEAGNSRLLIATKGNTTTTIEITDIDKLLGKSGKGVKKIFLYTLIAINQQAFSIDQKTGLATLRQTFVTFSLQDLVKAGLYKNIDTARVGFKAAMKALKENFAISGVTTQTKGKRKVIKQDIISSPFDNTYGIKDGQCIVGLSVNFNWQILAMYYTILPKYCFALKKINAFDLIYTIFYLARQNVDKIREQGYFTISLRTIQNRLGLPSEIGNRKPEEQIKTPINDAITEIEDISRDANFTITPIYNENGNIKEYLDRGYLKIGMSGEYAQAFIDLADNKEKQIEQAEKRKQKIADTAKAKALQKAIEAEKEANKKES